MIILYANTKEEAKVTFFSIAIYTIFIAFMVSNSNVKSETLFFFFFSKETKLIRANPNEIYIYICGLKVMMSILQNQGNYFKTWMMLFSTEPKKSTHARCLMGWNLVAAMTSDQHWSG